MRQKGVVGLVAQALEQLGFDRIRAQTLTVNTGSRRVLEKASFKHIDTVFPVFVHPPPGSEAGEVVYERQRCPVRGSGERNTGS